MPKLTSKVPFRPTAAETVKVAWVAWNSKKLRVAGMKVTAEEVQVGVIVNDSAGSLRAIVNVSL